MSVTDRIHVLFCIEAMVHGGTEKQLATLIRGLDRRRIEPSLCVLKPGTMDLAALDCEVIELGFRTFRSPATLGCVRRLRRFIHEQHIDIVHTCFQDPTLLGWLASLRTPVQARVAAFRDMGFWRTPAKVAQLRLAYPWFQGFIANSNAVARQVHEADGIPLDRIHVIPNGVAMTPPRARVTSAAPVVGIVANLDRPVKRVDLFLSAARLVHDSLPTARFVVVGDGHLRPAFERQAAALGLTSSVRFTGSLERPAEEIGRFDVGVICSDSEGLSNAILEYMAAGVPTVARAVGGNAEAVSDGETGYLVQDDGPAPLARALLRLLTDDRERRRMGEQARAIAERAFSVDVCIRRHEAYYSRLLATCAVRSARMAWSRS